MRSWCAPGFSPFSRLGCGVVVVLVSFGGATRVFFDGVPREKENAEEVIEAGRLPLSRSLMLRAGGSGMGVFLPKSSVVRIVTAVRRGSG